MSGILRRFAAWMRRVFPGGNARDNVRSLAPRHENDGAVFVPTAADTVTYAGHPGEAEVWNDPGGGSPKEEPKVWKDPEGGSLTVEHGSATVPAIPVVEAPPATDLPDYGNRVEIPRMAGGSGTGARKGDPLLAADRGVPARGEPPLVSTDPGAHSRVSADHYSDARQGTSFAAEITGEETGAGELREDDGLASATASEGIIPVREKPVETPGGDVKGGNPRVGQAPLVPDNKSIITVTENPDDAPGEGSFPGGDERPVSAPEAALVMAQAMPEGWDVHPGRESPFEKVGRSFIENGDLVIRLDKDPRSFLIREHDLDKVLTDGEGKVRTMANSRPVGTTRLSTSGRALNIFIDETLYTIPLRWLMLVLSGKRRKAAVWRGR